MSVGQIQSVKNCFREVTTNLKAEGYSHQRWVCVHQHQNRPKRMERSLIRSNVHSRCLVNATAESKWKGRKAGYEKLITEELRPSIVQNLQQPLSFQRLVSAGAFSLLSKPTNPKGVGGKCSGQCRGHRSSYREFPKELRQSKAAPELSSPACCSWTTPVNTQNDRWHVRLSANPQFVNFDTFSCHFRSSISK